MTNTKKLNPIQKLVSSPFFWIVFLALAFSIPLFRSWQKNNDFKELPRLGQVPNFELTDQFNKTARFKDFAGKVTVTNFIFTSCPDTCPIMTRQMAEVQKRLSYVKDHVRLISISVDPSNDSPEKLFKYAKNYGANMKLWSFLTGPFEEVQKTIIGGYKMALENPKETTPDKKAMDHSNHAHHQGHSTHADHSKHNHAQPDPGISNQFLDIVHGERFVIADRKGNIRSYRHARSEENIDQIVQDISILVNSPVLGR